MECWLFIQGIILVRGFAGGSAGERCSCSWAEHGSCLLGLSQLSAHHTWFGYKTPFHVESEISVSFHLVLPWRREFLFLLQPSGRCWRWGGMHLLLHFSLWQLHREFITVYFIKLHRKNNQSLIVFMAPFRTAAQLSVALNKNWFRTDKSSFCH